MASHPNDPPTSSQSVVRLLFAAGQSREGRIAELNDSGVLVDFVRQGAPEIAVGAAMTAVVTCDRVGSSVQVSGRVISRTEELHRLRLRFELGEDDLTALELLVDRRGQQRVQPEGLLQARICSPSGESLTLAKIHNLSRTGISLLLDEEEAKQVVDHSGVFLICLLLPGVGDPLELAAILRNQSQLSEGLYLGLEFGSSGASSFMRELDRIDAYVGKLQCDLLKSIDSDEQLKRA